MDTMNDHSCLPQDMLQRELLKKSEERLLDSLCKKDIDSAKFFWEIVSFYSKVVDRNDNTIRIDVPAGAGDPYAQYVEQLMENAEKYVDGRWIWLNDAKEHAGGTSQASEREIGEDENGCE